MAAAKGKFNPENILSFDLDRVGKLMGVGLAEAKRLLRSFGADPQVKKTGKMDVVQFAKALQLPLTDPVREMFSLLDTEDAGVLDFRAFLVGLTFVSHNASLADGVDVLFEALDTEGHGKISQQQLQTVLGKVLKKVDKSLVKRLMALADPDYTGFVDKQKFKAFCAKHPELLVIALQVKEQAKEKGRPLSVLRKNDLTDRELGVHPLKLKTIKEHSSEEVAVHVPETPPASAHIAPPSRGAPQGRFPLTPPPTTTSDSATSS
jgi:Ca2+-binding EF-hand superfamily protein